MYTDTRLDDIRYKISRVKENHNGKYKFPIHILKTLSIIEMTLEDNLFTLKQPT